MSYGLSVKASRACSPCGDLPAAQDTLPRMERKSRPAPHSAIASMLPSRSFEGGCWSGAILRSATKSETPTALHRHAVRLRCDRERRPHVTPKRKTKMALASLIVLYIICCLITAYFGRYRRMGYMGSFLLSVLITPLLMLLILAITGPSEGIEWRPKRE